MIRLPWLLLLASAASAAAEHQHAEPQVLAPGYADLEFVAPVPGSYRLPPIFTAADAVLVDSTGAEVSLEDVYADRITILSFIYTRCSDVNGCPLATYVLARLQERIAGAPDLAGRVQLVSVSFDPDYDTPEVMRRYRARFVTEGSSWRFLTPRSTGELASLLKNYDQWVVKDYDADGNYLGTMSHLLRVYLIDAAHRVRNIYSVSFLHADTVAADIRTLLLEAGPVVPPDATDR